MGRPLGLPELDAGRYLVEAMIRLDPVRSTGLDLRATDWPEISAFMQATGRITEGWEAELLFEMCAGYFAARQAGEDPLAVGRCAKTA
ncbi:hypothetical protein ABEB22_08790 [Thioclava sp. 'Guangxiensis']|uniref:hypothetical protein n=1 Tax=Thioclava sp. 'Guangxiensis' TaxID=3149044 RepID=UPI003877909A